MPITHKKVNKTKKAVRKGKKMSGGNRKVNRTRKVGGNRSRKVGRSRKMVGGALKSSGQRQKEAEARAAKAAARAKMMAAAKAEAKKERPAKIAKALFAPIYYPGKYISTIKSRKQARQKLLAEQQKAEDDRKAKEAEAKDRALARAVERQGNNMRGYGISPELVSYSSKYWGSY